MAEIDFLRDKIKSMQREKDQLQLQMTKMRSSQTFVAPAQHSNLQQESEQLKLDLVRLSGELAEKTALVATVQESLRHLESEHEKVKEDVAIASLSMENFFDDTVGRAVRMTLLKDAPPQFRDLLVFNDTKILADSNDLLSLEENFLPRFVKFLPYIHPSCECFLRGLLPDVRVGTDIRHLRVFRALVEVDSVTESEELWSLLVRICDVLKRANAPVDELYILATTVVKRVEPTQLKKLQKELSDLILRASHVKESFASDFLQAVASRTPDILAFAALRCNANCLNVAQRLLLQAVNGAFALSAMPSPRMRTLIKILAKITAVRAERGGRALELSRTLSNVNSSSEGSKIAPFRPPPIFGHLIDFVSAVVNALNMRPLYAADVALRSDVKILAAFFAEFSKTS
jgi:hypothetical protein